MGPGDLVGRCRAGPAAGALRVDRLRAGAAGTASAHGQRAQGPHGNAPARAARLSRAQLRVSDAGVGRGGAPDLRGDSGRVLFDAGEVSTRGSGAPARGCARAPSAGERNDSLRGTTVAGTYASACY